MTPQERDAIESIFEKLKQAEGQPRDPEAERLIAERVARQPYATYALAQAFHVHDQALQQYAQKVAALEAEITELKNVRGEQPNAGGFFSGPWGNAQQQPRAAAPQMGMGTAPQFGAQQQPGGMFGGGGGFLGTALSTAAGMAGGALLFQGLRGLFGGEHGAQPSAAASSFGDPSQLGFGTGEKNADANQNDSDNASFDTASDEDDEPFDDSFDDGGNDDSWA
jgi:hypothetical protein